MWFRFIDELADESPHKGYIARKQLENFVLSNTDQISGVAQCICERVCNDENLFCYNGFIFLRSLIQHTIHQIQFHIIFRKLFLKYFPAHSMNQLKSIHSKIQFLRFLLAFYKIEDTIIEEEDVEKNQIEISRLLNIKFQNKIVEILNTFNFYEPNENEFSTNLQIYNIKYAKLLNNYLVTGNDTKAIELILMNSIDLLYKLFQIKIKESDCSSIINEDGKSFGRYLFLSLLLSIIIKSYHHLLLSNQFNLSNFEHLPGNSTFNN